MMYTYVNLLFVGPMVWLSLFILGSTLFRHKINHHIKPILLSTLCLTIVSNTLQFNQWGILATIVQPVAFVFCFRYFFRIIWVHSIIMTLIIYSIGMTIDWSIHGVNAILTNNNLINTLTNNDHSLTIYIVIVHLVLAKAIRHYRIGFTFVEPFKISFRQPSGTNIFILLLGMVGAFIIGTTSLSLFLFQSLPFTIYGTLILTAAIIGLTAMYYFKEMQEE